MRLRFAEAISDYHQNHNSNSFHWSVQCEEARSDTDIDCHEAFSMIWVVPRTLTMLYGFLLVRLLLSALSIECNSISPIPNSFCNEEPHTINNDSVQSTAMSWPFNS